MTNEMELEIYDDGAFSVTLSRFGVYNSFDRDGHALTTSLSKEDCIFWSRNHLNGPLPGVTTYVTNVKLGTKDL